MKALQRAQARLKLANQRYSRTKRGSVGRNKAARRLGKIHTRVAHLRKNLLHELTAARGSVVNVTSIAGSRVHPFAGSAYGTSKAALAALTREMAADFAPRGIRVNAISPGEIDRAILSPGTERLIADIRCGGSASRKRWPRPPSLK